MIFNIKKGATAILKFLQRYGGLGLRWESNILDFTPQVRMVVHYSFFRKDTTSGSHPFLNLIGKFYANESGLAIYQAMKTLQSKLSQADEISLMAIPHPFLYDPDSRLIVQQYMEGTPYNNIFHLHDYPNYFRLVGKALAFLHAQNIPVGQTKSMDDHLRELIHPHPMKLCEELPQYQGLVEELIKAMRKKESARPKEIVISPLHRDFHLRQLFYKAEQVWVIDWDLFAKGDPALDVGNFIVYLKTHFTKERGSAIDAFLDGYFSGGPSTVLNRISLFEGLTYLRLACKRFRLKRANWKEKVKDMLLLSERCLNEESSYAKN